MLDTDRTATTATTPQHEAEQSITPPGKRRWLAWHRLALVGITLFSVCMNFYQLGKNGYSSYYPAGK